MTFLLFGETPTAHTLEESAKKLEKVEAKNGIKNAESYLEQAL